MSDITQLLNTIPSILVSISVLSIFKLAFPSSSQLRELSVGFRIVSHQPLALED